MQYRVMVIPRCPFKLWQQSIAYMQEYQEQAREARRAAREDARQAAEEGNAVEPLSAVAQRRLKLDMPHELAGHMRPGAMSRLPHTLQDYHATIGDIQVLCVRHGDVNTLRASLHRVLRGCCCPLLPLFLGGCLVCGSPCLSSTPCASVVLLYLVRQYGVGLGLVL